MPCKACHKPKEIKRTGVTFEKGGIYRHIKYGWLALAVQLWDNGRLRVFLANLGAGNHAEYIGQYDTNPKDSWEELTRLCSSEYEQVGIAERNAILASFKDAQKDEPR